MIIDFSVKELDQNFDTTAPIVPLCIVMDTYHVNRLARTCFRGKDLKKAGNFCRWNSIREFICDDEVQDQLFPELLESIQEMSTRPLERRTYTLSIELENPVGWSATLPSSMLPADALFVPFHPNEYTDAFLLEDHAFKAPLTHEITIVCEIDYFANRNFWVVAIKTIYPGESVQLGFAKNKKTKFIPASEAVFLDFDRDGE